MTIILTIIAKTDDEEGQEDKQQTMITRLLPETAVVKEAVKESNIDDDDKVHLDSRKRSDHVTKASFTRATVAFV